MTKTRNNPPRDRGPVLRPDLAASTNVRAPSTDPSRGGDADPRGVDADRGDPIAADRVDPAASDRVEAPRASFDGASPALAPAPAAPGRPSALLALRLEPSPGRESADSVARGALRDLERQAARLKNAKGGGLEHWGTGDPDAIARRRVVARLADLPDGMATPVIGERWATRDLLLTKRFDRSTHMRPLAGAIEESIAILEKHGAKPEAAKLRAIKNDPKKLGTTTWREAADIVHGAVPRLQGDARAAVEGHYFAMILEDRMAQAARANEENADKQAKEIVAGTRTFFELDPQRVSTRIVQKLPEALRAQTLADIVLQLREPIDRDIQVAKDTAGGAGVQSALEVRALAAKLDARPGQPTAEREYALARLVALSSPAGSGNAVLEARHVVGKLRRLSWELVYGERARPAGMKLSPYEAIHHNFSLETPEVIAAFVRENVFGGRPETFCRLVDAWDVLRREGDNLASRAQLDEVMRGDPDVSAAWREHCARPEMANRKTADRLESFLVGRVKGRLDSKGINDPALSEDEKKHLRNGQVQSVRGQYFEKLSLVSRLYRTICEDLPGEKSLTENLLTAHRSMIPVAKALGCLRMEAPNAETLEALADARTAVRAEIAVDKFGYRRTELWQLDRQLDALVSAHLGVAVERIGKLETNEERVEALHAMRAALISASASSLDELRDLDDPRTAKGPTVKSALAELDALVKNGSADLAEYQGAMARAYEAVVRTTENMRAYFDRRIPEVSEGKLVPNPAFMDDLVKEGPLHYARAIGQKALTVGLEHEMSPTRFVNPPGVAVLNSLGRVVFDRVVLAESMSDLKELGAGRKDMCWVKKMDEKKMLAVGGIMSAFPGGYCHAAVYARGAGIAALSNPEISKVWFDFAGNLAGDKLYYDDSNGRVVMMPAKAAVAEGLVKTEELSKLQPGTNRIVKYWDWSEAEAQYRQLGEHRVVVDLERSTQVVELFGTGTTIAGAGERAMSFGEIAALGPKARALVGEKSLVLGLMSQDPELKDHVPPGSAISTLRVQRLLGDAGVLETWTSPWAEDPAVGRVTSENFLESRFYTDAKYREETRLEVQKKVRESLLTLLLDDAGQPTAKGKELLDELRANADLAACENWIVRSSFTAEDRPGKSGAGQYDSFPNCKTDEAILRGVVGVISSGWESAPIENNVAEEYELSRIWPAITVMKCLDSEYSGVALSRDTDTGHRRTASYQAVVGFGGGVEDGVTEEGRLREGGKNDLLRALDGRDESLLPAERASELWRAVMAAERLFHRTVEPGRGLAVDMEWVVENGKLWVVQARTVRV